MFWLEVAAERRKATVVGGAQAIGRDVFGSCTERIANLFCRLPCGIEWVDDADETELGDTVGILATMLATELVDCLFVIFTSALDQKVASINQEHALQEQPIGYFFAMHRVAITSRACVYSNLDPIRKYKKID
ncbi:unnamed protein product [Sphagnum jensenii]|uniref:Uncharacterized protein n=1 Tax=Sphagnum jensenii TaxID=128206 RepID=A0ABP1AFS6_9BRYO